MNHPYIGHPSQLYGVEEHRLVGGKGDGMRLFQVKNGLGLELTVCADRCADLSRLSFLGVNYGYFASCGYVGPAYYDDRGTGFLKSFHGGFLTTCGLTNVGIPVRDDGEELPQHGRIGNCPAEAVSVETGEEWIALRAVVNPTWQFGEKLILRRAILVSRKENRIVLRDQVCNIGGRPSPLMLMYHFNMGYPLLDEHAVLDINSSQVLPRNERAAEGLEQWKMVLPPQAGFEEQCYYHRFSAALGKATLYNPKVGRGVSLSFDTGTLNQMVQWKQFGHKDYAMGLEPSNCHGDGRDKLRKENQLEFLEPGAAKDFEVVIEAFDRRPEEV